MYTIKSVPASAYALLAHHHYRAGAPAVPCGALGAFCNDETGGERRAVMVGILVVAHPVLNAPWRAVAWPERFATRADAGSALGREHHFCKVKHARCARELVRCIARVVVDPRYRARGIASGLIRHYLASPLTPLTESIAAMGSIHPLFVRAGMRPIAITPSRADRALLSELRALGIAPHALAAPGALAARLARQGSLHAATTHLERWSKHSRATRGKANGAGKPGGNPREHLVRLLTLAAQKAACGRTVYVHGSSQSR